MVVTPRPGWEGRLRPNTVVIVVVVVVVVSIECSDTRQSVVEPARRNYMSESLE